MSKATEAARAFFESPEYAALLVGQGDAGALAEQARADAEDDQ
jgi:hypothetical protein